MTYYKDNDIKVVKFNIGKLVSCLGFLYGFVAIYLQVELIWTVISFSLKSIFNISIQEMEDKMLKELLYHVTNNTGPFLMITGIFELVVMILLSKFGIINKFQEKIDQIGGINRFKITPIDLGQDSTNLTLTIAVQIKNIGFNESNLTNWSLTLITGDKEKIIGTPCYSMDKITIMMGDKKTYTFPKLYENSNVILEAGKSIVGAIQFNINILLKEYLMNSLP